MLSIIGNILLLPWSLITQGAMKLGSLIRGAGSLLLTVALIVGGAMLLNKLLGMRSTSSTTS